MLAQISMFQNEKQVKLQRKLLNELIELKAKDIQDKEFHNLYGTVEELAVKREIVDKKVSAFVDRVRKTFPDVLD